jgi:hypothetical protein
VGTTFYRQGKFSRLIILMMEEGNDSVKLLLSREL